MHRFAFAVRAACLAAGVAVAAGCTSSESADRRPNIVLALVDTTRADRMSLYGYARKTTPHLERLAAGAVVFETARSQASCTFPSVNSLLTSRAPHHFFGQKLGDWSIPAETTSIAEILAAHGWATAAVSASSVVRATPSGVNKIGGYGRGFTVFDESCERKDASCVTRRALHIIARLPKPYFLYLHFMEPHHPYAAPKRFRHHFARPSRAVAHLRRGDPKPLLTALYKKKERRRWEAEIAYLSDSYDDEIHYFDTAFAHLLRQLRERAGGRETIVVLASDHGEDFLEHEHLMHCRSLYETSLRVPLVMWLPGAPPGRIAEPVENLDIVPTVLDYAGIDPAAHGFEGTSLRGRIEGRREADAGPGTVAVQDTLRAVVEGDHKLLYDLATSRGRLYDVAADPGERNDLAAARTEVAERLERRLLERVAKEEGRGDSRRAVRVSKRVQEGLRALGYLD